MMVLKTVFVSTFVAGTFAATDEFTPAPAQDRVGAGEEEKVHDKPAPKYDAPEYQGTYSIPLGSAYKLGRIDKNKIEMMSKEASEKHRAFRLNRVTNCITWNGMEDNFELFDFEPETFEFSQDDVDYFGAHIKIYKPTRNEKGPCFLSLAFEQEKVRTEFMKEFEGAANQGSKYWVCKLGGNKVVAESVVSARVKNVLADGRPVYGLGIACKGKISEKPAHLPADFMTTIDMSWRKEVNKRDMFYQPEGHCIGFHRPGQKPSYKSFPILDKETEALHKITIDGKNIASGELVTEDGDKYYVWTIVVEKVFEYYFKPDQTLPSLLRLVFQDRRNMEEFQMRFRFRASQKEEKIALGKIEDIRKIVEGRKGNGEILLQEELERRVTKKQIGFPSIYGRPGDLAHIKNALQSEKKADDRRRLMTRRRLALERLYPRGN